MIDKSLPQRHEKMSWFRFPTDWDVITASMNNDEKACLVNNACEYIKGKEEEELSFVGNSKFIWSLFAEKYLDESINSYNRRSKSNKQNRNKWKSDFVPPTLEEVIAFAEDNNIGMYLEKDAKEYATRFYYHYNANGWNNITDWESKFNQWINDDDKEHLRNLYKPCNSDDEDGEVDED